MTVQMPANFFPNNLSVPANFFPDNLSDFSIIKESESEVTQLCPTLCDPWFVVGQAPPSMGFSRQEYWSGLPFPSPGDVD